VASIDVLGLGAVAVDDILFLPSFPKPDSKMPILGRERHPGGLSGTALVAARRMGRTVAYAGTLGDDELSRFILDGFEAEGVSVEHVVRRRGTRPFHSTILVEQANHTRTILLNTRDVAGADPAAPSEELIRGARVLLVDHIGMEGMVRAARIARAAGIPVVADLERDSGPLTHELIGLVDHLILPFEFARRLSGGSSERDIVRRLWTDARAAVVITRSEDGSWYQSTEEPGRFLHQPAFRVDPVDTNGCGDVFHGVYAAGLAERLPIAERVRLASAVAALKATQPGGQQGIPSREAAERFLSERSAEARRAPA